MAYFCNVTGIRIAEPGLHVSVDPVNGKPAVIEDADGAPVLQSVDTKPAEGLKKPKQEPPAAPKGEGEPKPAEGSK
jgi:hypothetical protein